MGLGFYDFIKTPGKKLLDVGFYFAFVKDLHSFFYAKNFDDEEEF